MNLELFDDAEKLEFMKYSVVQIGVLYLHTLYDRYL
jgi:hypothetical protein